jgi:uroporphyrinogen decarboxylase
MGQPVTFEAGDGPRLDVDVLGQLRETIDHRMLEPIYATIGLAREALAPEVALIGFCGAPWTVASYMVAGQGTPDQAPARAFAYSDPPAFGRLVDRLVTASVEYLVRQFHAGVDTVQIFDTWAGILPPEEFQRWCIEPVARIVSGVRTAIPGAPIIGFPRGAGSKLERYIDAVSIDAVSLDWTIDLAFARDRLQTRKAIQGNLDPVVLLAGGKALDQSIDRILESFNAGPFIFNLGHGVLPDTPVAHVEQLVARVRASA